jgi:hypothetical protein
MFLLNLSDGQDWGPEDWRFYFENINLNQGKKKRGKEKE